MSRTDLPAHVIADALRRMAGDGSMEWVAGPISASVLQLRDNLQCANEAVQDAEHDESMAWDRVRKAEAENVRLRELVGDMYACISHANEADWFNFERDKFGCGMSCTVNGETCGLCALADRMQELGIEIEQ